MSGLVLIRTGFTHVVQLSNIACQSIILCTFVSHSIQSTAPAANMMEGADLTEKPYIGIHMWEITTESYKQMSFVRIPPFLFPCLFQRKTY